MSHLSGFMPWPCRRTHPVSKQRALESQVRAGASYRVAAKGCQLHGSSSKQLPATCGGVGAGMAGASPFFSGFFSVCLEGSGFFSAALGGGGGGGGAAATSAPLLGLLSAFSFSGAGVDSEADSSGTLPAQKVCRAKHVRLGCGLSWHYNS